MIRSLWMAALVSLAVVSPAFADNVPGNLPAPEVVACPNDGTTINADWSDVVDATKYSVEVVSGYDLNGDGVVDVTLDTDFSAKDSALAIPLSALAVDFDTNGDGVVDLVGLAPIAVDLRVKALNPGKGHGRQNNVFSAFCHVLP